MSAVNACEGGLLFPRRKPWFHPSELKWALLAALILPPVMLLMAVGYFKDKRALTEGGCGKCAHDVHNGACAFLSSNGATSPFDYAACRCPEVS